MRYQLSLMAACAMACLAPETDAGSAPLPPSAPSDGQIALTAHNNGDGTWSVKRGPNGPVLETGLPRERAFAIVGGLTGPYEPSNAQEAAAAEHRAALEQKEAEREAATANLTDAEVGDPLKVGREADAALVEENATLRAENEGLKAQVEDLTSKLAKFDPDGDGNPGGSTGGMTKEQVAAELTQKGVEFDPKAKKADLVALLANQPVAPVADDQAPAPEAVADAAKESTDGGAGGSTGGAGDDGKNNGG